MSKFFIKIKDRMRNLLLTPVLTLLFCPLLCRAQQDTVFFQQCPFEWHVHPRFDYSQTLVTKLFLCQALYDGDYLGHFKMRDNGKQEVCMTIEQAFEAIKGLDAITLGMPKIVYLVGWQYLGHDSKYPAYFEGNTAIKRPQDKDALESVRWLMKQAKKYHTTVSLHINSYDCYDDSPLYDTYRKADVLAKDEEGMLVHGDWGYKISYTAEWNAGLFQKRIDKLLSILPIQKQGTLHIDAFHSQVPSPYKNEKGEWNYHFLRPISPYHGFTREEDIATQQKMIKYLDDKGVDVTSEFFPDEKLFDGYMAYVWNYNVAHPLTHTAQQSCGGSSNDDFRCYGENARAEESFRDADNMEEGFEDFKQKFCLRTLVTNYLNRLGRVARVSGTEHGNQALFEHGVKSAYDHFPYVSQNGNVLAADGDVLMPALWRDKRTAVAYSHRGCTRRTWILPEEVKAGKKVKAYTITAHGIQPFTNLSWDGRMLTISLKAHEMVELIF